MGTMALLYYIKPDIISITISADEILRAIPCFSQRTQPFSNNFSIKH